jgi:acyl-CoA synthetase (AMP-forming)/AMP-acid ligase II
MSDSSTFATLEDALRFRTASEPDRVAYIFLADGETETARVTYKELSEQARLIADHLRAVSAPGDRVLLIYPPGLEFAAAMLGCFFASAIAVPAIPDPSPRAIARFRKVIADAQATLVLTTEMLLGVVQGMLADETELLALKWLPTDTLVPDASHDTRYSPPRPADLAFIQYTSGSTSDPKGVAVSHGNLVYNQEMLQAGLKSTKDTTIVSWLPVYHDLGLIAQLLHSLYVGSTCVLMPPMAFLQRPMRWLNAITRYQGVFSASPNFGYELCLRKASDEDCAKLDLSTWSLAMNAAEPIRHSTIERFIERFAPCGFSQQAFFPGYGLAEATICVSGGPRDQGAKSLAVDSQALAEHRVETVDAATSGAQLIVASGCSQLEEEIAIVDPETCCASAAGQIGEIWVRGRNIAGGYWAQPDETAAVFGAYTADTGAGPFLRTGDLGFMRDEQLFVTGRLKDLIIIRGRNFYPQDIELTVEQSHTALRPGCGAAFAVTRADAEHLVVMHEARDDDQGDAEQAVIAIRRAILRSHGIGPHAILLLPPRAVIKTSSGKIARRACREAFESRGLASILEWTDPRYVAHLSRRAA